MREDQWWRMCLGIVLLCGAACAPLPEGGIVAAREPDGLQGPPIAGARVTLVPHDGAAALSHVSDGSGGFSIPPAAGRYHVRVTHPEFEDYAGTRELSRSPDDPGGRPRILLRRARVTTVFVVRHAEKLNPDGHVPQEPLSPAGVARAEALKAMLQPTGITAIYSTDTVRTLGTAGPLADQLQLEPILYDTPEDLGERLLSSNRGDVVLVVGHSNTLGPIARALGGEVPEQTVGDYDNLLVVTRAKGVVNVMNLQFGEESSPDLMKTHNQGSQLMLVEEATGSDQVERLAHRLRKAGLEALLATGGHTSFSAISGRLGLPIQSLDPGSLSDSIPTLLRDHPRQNVAVSTAGPILADIYVQLTGDEGSLDALPRSGLLLVTPYDEGVRATGIVY